ncbi:MAG: low molecular weight protein arginine phosphatase [Clostridiales bacterium]|uniref:low molecular weight protein arginine phosphatase n=1 Tax=Clostridium sp. N3C TaxID=1776758 RepID=UPI00092E05C9|nr:low molecular weight protein arginine phosphatase [Clostridium sp. N3C]NLZ47265.1 low molecular weight protein arginine phosphatase [Clostridiales bacterium]SCN23881.1 Low molecular weight protein-tyrosine-phosphatase YwlE [Clostridium sp. N3C]
MNILFVCSGNTCRSCMAEAIFNHYNTISDIKAFSAGVAAIKGSKTSKNSAVVVETNTGVNIADREAVQLTQEQVHNSDLILTMTYSIKNYLVSLFPDFKNKIYVLNEYVGAEGEVSDPYGGDIAVYNNTFKSLKKYIDLLLLKLKEDISK